MGPYLSRVENGHADPTLGSLEKLAKAFRIEFYHLFYNGENSQAVVKLERECAGQIREAMAERDKILPCRPVCGDNLAAGFRGLPNVILPFGSRQSSGVHFARTKEGHQGNDARHQQ
jgi:transcriptional regulator with XRE-family HTH domain